MSAEAKGRTYSELSGEEQTAVDAWIALMRKETGTALERDQVVVILDEGRIKTGHDQGVPYYAIFRDWNA